MTTEKTNPSLSAFLEEDREHILSELKADPSETHAKEVLSRELERLMYRAAEADMGESAQNMLITVDHCAQYPAHRGICFRCGRVEKD